MDFVKDYEVIQCLDADITTNTTTTGVIMDMYGYRDMCAFTIAAPTVVSGTFTLSIYQGDESDLSDAAEVTTVTYTTSAATTADTATADGAQLPAQGIFDFKQYVQARVVSTAVAGTNHVAVNCIREKLLKPVAQA